MFNNQSMYLALNIAKEGLLAGEVPVGAVIVNPINNQIIAQNYNLVEKDKDPTAHAEMLAIKSACQQVENKSLAGLDLYVTLQPCIMCLKAMFYAKIRRVYFGAYDARIDIINIMNSLANNHEMEIYGGILAEECKHLLDDFFRDKR